MVDRLLPGHHGLHSGQQTCKFCDGVLNPHQVAKGGICDAPRCQMRRVQDASRAVFQRNWDSYVGRQRRAIESAGPSIAAAARRLAVPTDQIAVGVIPHQNRPIVAQPAERRAELAAHLDEIIAKAFAEGEPDLDLSPREREEANEEPIIDATCATCQGKCCILGGPAHGFLTQNNIQQFRQRNPGAAAEAIKQHYLDSLPERSVEHSCLFHGAMGCVLGRHERGDVCNRYHCNPQTQLLLKMREMKSDHAVIVANEDDAGPNIATFDTARGWQPLTRDADIEGFSTDDIDDAALIQSAIDAAIAQLPPDLPSQGSSVPPAEKRCKWCNEPIDGHKAMTTGSCGRQECERRRIADASKRVTEQKHERYIARQERVTRAYADELQDAAQAAGIDRETLVIGVVPHQNKPLIPLSDERRAAFEAHLDAIAAEGFAIEDPENYVNVPNREVIDRDEDPIADACCATCQGSCCRLGGETFAFLSKYDVCRFRQEAADPSPEAFKAYYLERLPEHSVSGACDYQTDQGCTLSRSMRADICNAFQCKGLKMLVEAWGASERPSAAIIAHRDGDPRALGLFDDTLGWRPVIKARD